MNDFLATLAARIRPTAPPIEPRRGAFFESPARETPPVEMTAETTSTPAVPAPPTLPRASAETTLLPLPQFQPAPLSGPQPPSAPAIAAPGILRSPPSAPAPMFEPVRVMAARETPAGPTPEKNSLVPREVPPAPPQPFVAPTHSILMEKIISVSVPPPIVPAHVESRDAPPPLRAGPLLASPVVRLIEPALRASAQPTPGPAPAEPPVIRVTIGRVEVRAVVPPAPQQAQPPAAKKSNPVISLDDYLKQQSSRSARA